MAFQITVQELCEINEKKDVKFLKERGGIERIAAELKTDLKDGIPESEKFSEYQDRIAKFGRNEYPKPPAKWFFQLLFEALQDTMLVILMIMGVISIALGLLFPETPEERAFGWIEGFAILLAVFIVSMVTAINDWSKERKFRNLSEQNKKNITVKVRRGGNPLNIKINEVLVGDVVMLESGDQVPADGILIEGFDLKTDESVMTGETDMIKKSADAPFMLSGCQVAEGVGSMLVTGIGEYSEWGKTLAKLNESESQNTPLEEKLDTLAGQVGKAGVFFAVATFLVLTIGWLVKKIIDVSYKRTDWSLTDLSTVIRFLVISITIVVVAVPEGLPLAVTISLAYSVQKMMKDNNLVRHLAACETMGGATTICSDKTGTLTLNQMRVKAGYFGGKDYPDSVPKKDEINPKIFDLIVEGIGVNSTAALKKKEIKDPKLKTDDKDEYEVIGNKTESALLLLCNIEWGVDYETVRHAYNEAKRKVFTFSSKRKKMSTIIDLTKRSDGKKDESGARFRLHTKGASEIVLELCNRMMMPDGSVAELTPEKKKELEEIIDRLAESGKRTLCLGFKDFDEDMGEVWDNEEETEKDLTFLCIVGIEDPLRDDVKDSVAKCQRSGIIVRMVTGDNPKTAKNIAQQCGIYQEGALVMEGPEFRKLSDEELDAILPKLRVLARSSPTDKHRLVSRLIENGEVVAVTGDGTNDAPALKKADVGLAMGKSGTQVAQEASDIIIMDDNFTSIVLAVKWGRSIYENIRKFLQFQLTVNVVALVLTIIASFSTFAKPSDEEIHSLELPLTAVQLLWVNLIMDTFAALALATEPPVDELLERKPYGRKDSLITLRMWFHIIGQAIFQLAVLLVLYYAGPFLFYEAWGTPVGEFERLQTNTAVFNAFVFCQIFNEINCRKIQPNQWNVLQGIHRSWLFIFIFCITSLFQAFIVELIWLDRAFGWGDNPIFSRFVQTVGLTWWQWLITVGIGFLSIPYSQILRAITRFIPEEINLSCLKLEEESESDDDDEPNDIEVHNEERS